MDHPSTVRRGVPSSAIGQKTVQIARPQGGNAAHASAWSLISRILAALIMGLILLVMSGLLHTAAAAAIGGGWSYLWAIWLVAVFATLFIALGAPTARMAWGRLCLVNGLVAVAMFVASVVALPATEGLLGETADQTAWFGLVRPLGAAFGFALASGVLGIAAVIIAALCFAAFYLLRHFGSRSHRHA